MAGQPRTPDPLYSLVVIGASAGGVEALTHLVAALSPRFPTPIVVAQHLDPRRRSQLGEILVRRSALPVHVLTDGAPQALVPGTIHVIPSNRNVEITDSRIALLTSRERGPRPSIDHLLTTAASAYGEGLIAVILTGSGSDGAAGARAVKRAGGTVVIENPMTASYPSMPASLAPTTVDVVADLERIGPLLRDLVTGAYAPSPPDAEDLMPALLRQVRARSGLDFTRYKPASMHRRLQRRMAATGNTSLRDYMSYLDHNPAEYARLTSSFLIKVTSFFRDRELFVYLKEHVVPDILAYARAHERKEVRIWSAGCATGEETYSLAILLHDTLGDQADDLTIRIYATDLDAAAIAFARRGIYSRAALSGLPQEYKQRYFRAVEGGFAAAEELRRLVVFGEHDLGRDAPFPKMDLVLCQNVLIYFTRELQRRVLKLFAFSLRNGGFLLLGKAESAAKLADYFTRPNARLSVFRRRGDHVLMPPVRQGAVISHAPGLFTSLPGGGRSGTVGMPESAQSESQPSERALPTGQALLPPQPVSSRERLGSLLLSLPLGVVAVDHHFDVVAINAIACRLLGIYRPVIGEDLLHLVERVPVEPLREALDAVTRTPPPAAAQPRAIVLEAYSGDPQRVYVALYPSASRPEAPYGVDTVLIFVSSELALNREQVIALLSLAPGQRVRQDRPQYVDSGAQLTEDSPRGQAEPDKALSADAEPTQLQRNQELAARVYSLEAANRDLMDLNLELRRGEEEALLHQEELQANDEQIRTLNEELRATNEEVETINEELEASVEELSITNDDLLARSRELQQLVVQREVLHAQSEHERARLAAVLASLAEAVLVVDRAGKPILANGAYTAIFGPIENDAAPLPALYSRQGNRLDDHATPQARARERQPFRMEFQLRGSNERRRSFRAEGRPIPDGAGNHLGGVVTFWEMPDDAPGRDD